MSNDVCIAFVCVENAGRSQMAALFAEKMIESNDMDISVVNGGTDPADKIHENVVKVMKEKDINISGRKPSKISTDTLKNCNFVITMGCSANDVCPATFVGDSRDWDLPDPKNASITKTREIRDEIENKVSKILREI